MTGPAVTVDEYGEIYWRGHHRDRADAIAQRDQFRRSADAGDWWSPHAAAFAAEFDAALAQTEPMQEAA